MRNITTILLLILLCITATHTFSQVKYGVKVGLNLTKLSDKDNEGTYSNEYKMKTGFHFGVTAEVPFSESFSFEPGLIYSLRGFTTSRKSAVSGEQPVEPKLTMYLNYLVIPLNAIYKIRVGKSKIFISAGPYLGYALSGKLKADTAWFGINGDQPERKVLIGNNSTNDIKPFDYGFNLGAGIELYPVTLGAQYGFSISNIAPANDYGRQLKNKIISFALSYKFVKEIKKAKGYKR